MQFNPGAHTSIGSQQTPNGGEVLQMQMIVWSHFHAPLFIGCGSQYSTVEPRKGTCVVSFLHGVQPQLATLWLVNVKNEALQPGDSVHPIRLIKSINFEAANTSTNKQQPRPFVAGNGSQGIIQLSGLRQDASSAARLQRSPGHGWTRCDHQYRSHQANEQHRETQRLHGLIPRKSGG